MMQRWFGHSLTFTASTDAPNADPKTRTFTSFEQAAEEDALGRLWLGVHYVYVRDQGKEPSSTSRPAGRRDPPTRGLPRVIDLC
ncbi:hypothetical protein [Microbispora siamensis]|nr:hypothetical protein [Microbispora siamensis]